MNNFLKTIKIIFLGLIVLMIIVIAVFYLIKTRPAKDVPEITKIEVLNPVYIGPRQNIPDDAPEDYDHSKKVGFWSFAIAVDRVLSRSGQPTYEDFNWLKENGWRGVVDTREDGEYGEITDDQKIKGFNELGFNYLYIPMKDNTAPTNEQAESFLNFVTNPKNQPVHLHCMAGIGRTGTLTALYRYSVQGWSLDDAIEEAKLFNGGLNEVQKDWIKQWAQNHRPGEYFNKR